MRRTVETPVDYVERLAREKALSVPGGLVLGADTTVVVRDEILEKPADAADALRMLRSCRGGPTGGHLGRAGGRRAIHQATDVTTWSSAAGQRRFLEAYIAHRRADGQGGRVRHQGYGAALVERIEGDFFSVMGLPLRLVLELLEQAGRAYRFDGRSGTAAVTEVR